MVRYAVKLKKEAFRLMLTKRSGDSLEIGEDSLDSGARSSAEAKI